MAKKSLEDLNVKAGDKIIIKGVVAFSEIATRVEGERLAEKVKRQEDRGFKFPETKPHFGISIVDVDVEDKFKGTPLAEYYGQNVYKNKDGKIALSLITKSPFEPNVYHKVAGGKGEQIKLEAELAPGQEVEILIEAYAPKTYSRLGSSFNAIMLPEGDIKYYGNNASTEIEAFGVELIESSTPVETEEVTAPVADQAPAKEAVAADASNPFASTGVTAAAPNPFDQSTPAASTAGDNPFQA